MNYGLLGVELPGGSFYHVLAPQGAMSIDPQAFGTTTTPVIVLSAWAYLRGKKPAVRTAHVLASAAGTSFVMQRIPGAGATPSRTRVILLDGDSCDVEVIASPSTNVTLAPGQYVDCWESATPYFSTPATFQEGVTPGSENLIVEVEAARLSWRV